MFNKITLIYFVVVLATGPTTEDLLHNKICMFLFFYFFFNYFFLVWFIVYGAIFAAALSLLTNIFIPTFPSNLIVPKMIETIVDERNFYSMMALYLESNYSEYLTIISIITLLLNRDFFYT